MVEVVCDSVSGSSVVVVVVAWAVLTVSQTPVFTLPVVALIVHASH